AAGGTQPASGSVPNVGNSDRAADATSRRALANVAHRRVTNSPRRREFPRRRRVALLVSLGSVLATLGGPPLWAREGIQAHAAPSAAIRTIAGGGASTLTAPTGCSQF